MLDPFFVLFSFYLSNFVCFLSLLAFWIPMKFEWNCYINDYYCYFTFQSTTISFYFTCMKNAHLPIWVLRTRKRCKKNNSNTQCVFLLNVWCAYKTKVANVRLKEPWKINLRSRPTTIMSWSVGFHSFSFIYCLGDHLYVHIFSFMFWTEKKLAFFLLSVCCFFPLSSSV